MNFNVIQFLRDYKINVAPDGHEHSTDGSEQVDCPFCSPNSGNYRLGIIHNTGHGNCWVCRGHGTIKIIKALTRCNTWEAFRILNKYSTEGTTRTKKKSYERKEHDLVLPLTSGELKPLHINYLISRGFCIQDLKPWGLLGTSVYGLHGNRIVAPVYFEGELVNYIARDVTGISKLRYVNCTNEDSVIELRNLLYGHDEAAYNESVIVFEGVTSVWRFGPGTVALFGMAYSMAQLYLLSKFKNVYIWFDKGARELEQARRLANELAMVCDNVEVITMNKVNDPAELSQADADKFKAVLLEGI